MKRSTFLPLTAMAISLLCAIASVAEPVSWPNGASTAVSLSYDDAIDSQLDNALPALNRHGLKASFYLVVSSDSLRNRFAEWREVALQGHELGNHTIYHPCSGSLPDRDWVAPYADIDNYSVDQIRREVVTANTFLRAIDDQTLRTFTPPCDDLYADGENYLPAVAAEFIGIKGQLNGMDEGASILWAPDGASGDELVAWVKEHSGDGVLLNILFHGVGGDYLSVSTQAHDTLLQFLAENQDTYWVDTFLNIMMHIRNR